MRNQTEISEQKPTGYARYALVLLMFVYTLNFLDRAIIYILFLLINKEMSFSDTRLEILGTTFFVIFYTLLGIPFGRLADKGSRTKIIVIGLAVWSLSSGITAFADSFWTLFACRVMVGVGEAALGRAAISLLSDCFPPAKRAGVNIAAYLIGSNLTGMLNDVSGAAVNPAMMRYSLLVCPVSCLSSAICLRLGSLNLNKNEIFSIKNGNSFSGAKHF